MFKKSSNIKSSSYDAKKHVLTLTFHTGDVYEYHGVPPVEYTKFQLAKSHGEHFAENIKNNYKFKRTHFEPRKKK